MKKRVEELPQWKIILSGLKGSLRKRNINKVKQIRTTQKPRSRKVLCVNRKEVFRSTPGIQQTHPYKNDKSVEITHIVSPQRKEKDTIQQRLSKEPGTNITLTPTNRVSKSQPIYVLDSSKKLNFIFSQRLNSYLLLPLSHDGIDLENQRNESNYAEFHLGLDFGTSTLKCFINDVDREMIFPIVFCDSLTSSAYLLPTCIYIDADQTVTLDQSNGAQVLDLKERLIKDHKSLVNRSYACAFLALALRRIRGWIKENLKDWYGDAEIGWVVHLGVPSVTAENGLAQTWKEILYAAWAISSFPRPVSLIEVKKLLNDGKNTESNVDIRTEVCPEISAAIRSVISCTQDSENGQLYASMDVGASTVDISAFFFTKGFRASKYETTLVGPQVHVLGTKFCHTNRISSLEEFVNSADLKTDERNAFINALQSHRSLQPYTPLPDSVEEYCEGIRLCIPAAYGPDKALIEKLAESLRERILKAWEKGFSMNSKKIKVLLVGGGRSSKPYTETVERAVKKANANRAELMEFPELPEELSYSRFDSHRLNKENFWQRFSVAFGLSLGNIGKTEIIPLDDESTDYEPEELPGFIGKELV